jgi:hypothetical protein
MAYQMVQVPQSNFCVLSPLVLAVCTCEQSQYSYHFLNTLFVYRCFPLSSSSVWSFSSHYFPLRLFINDWRYIASERKLLDALHVGFSCSDISTAERRRVSSRLIGRRPVTDHVSRQSSSQSEFTQPPLIRETVGLDAASRANADSNNTALDCVVFTNLNPFDSFRRFSVFGLVAGLP